MKKLLIALTLSLAVFLPRAQAINPNPLPFLNLIRSEVTNQLTLASNAVANAVATTNRLEATRQRRFITLLNGARRTIERTKTNYVAGSTTLNALNRTLGHSAFSNEFNPLIEQTFDIYIGTLLDIEGDLSDRVEEAYPGRAHDAAVLALDKLLAAINNAYTNANILVRFKSLAAAARGEALSQKAVVRAEAAPAPAAGITGKVTGTITSNIKTLGAAISEVTANNFNITGLQGSPLSKIDYITIVLYGVPEGTSTISLTEGIFTRSVANTPPPRTFDRNDTGTATVTRNSANKTLFGTFTLTLTEDDLADSVTLTGSFSGTY